MTSIFTTAVVVAAAVLVIALIILVQLNWSEKVKAPLIPVILIAAGTMLTTIFSNLKEVKKDDFFLTSTILDSATYQPAAQGVVDPKLNARIQLYHYWSNTNNGNIDTAGELQVNVFKPLSTKEDWLTFSSEAIVYHILQTIMALSQDGANLTIGDTNYQINKIKLPIDTGTFHTESIKTDFQAFRFYKVNLLKFKMPGQPYERDYVVKNFPDGIEVSMVTDQKTKQSTLRLYKAQYFEILFHVVSLGEPVKELDNVLYKKFGLTDNKISIAPFKTSMSATYFKWSSAGDRSASYQEWGNSLFDAIKSTFDDQ